EDQVGMRQRMEIQLQNKGEELKREFVQRDHERTQYWEHLVSQVRAEKEALRADLGRREEEMARLRLNLSELKRQLEVERGEWQVDLEKARRVAREDALRDLPDNFEERLVLEHK